MKVINQHENIGSPWLIALVLASTVAASADVIRQTVSYPPETVAGWANIHFGGDDATGLSFEMAALGFETGGTMFLKVHPSQTTEVLLKDWGVLPLQLGDTVPPAPAIGQWGASGLESFVFSMSYTSSPESPPPGQGVGMPGYMDGCASVPSIRRPRLISAGRACLNTPTRHCRTLQFSFPSLLPVLCF